MTAPDEHSAAGFEAPEISHRTIQLGVDEPLRLDCGVELRDFPMAFETYGTLNESKSNAILVCHALSGDQYVAGDHPMTGRPGWWEVVVGPGKILDTDKYFVICSNILGGCMGTAGPKETNPKRASLGASRSR